MKSKSLQVLCTFILLTVVVSTLAMATSVYGHLVPSIPLFVTESQSHSISEPLPSVIEAEEVIRQDRAVFEKVYQRAAEINFLSSLLIQKKGEILVEDYFTGMDSNRPVNIKSVSKSIMSLLIGIALDRGILNSKKQTLGEFFPEYLDENTEQRKASITIEDLLTMRAGLKTTSFENYSRWVSSSNWVRYALEQPMVEEPGGQRMIYSTGSSHLLSVILTKASGMSTRAFAQRYLFDPLGIELGRWDRDPQGYYVGGNNMYLRPSDMVRIGQMVLNGGSYNGRQIVPEQWLIDSFRTYTKSNNNSNYYGYMWWKQEVGGYQSVFACGYGGQYIFILPELESVVAITSHLEYADDLRQYHEPIFDLLESTIIPYILESGADTERIVHDGYKGGGHAVAR